MLLRRIGTSIALQFTAFVFLLLLINGLLFLGADFERGRRQTFFRLDRTFEFIDRMGTTFDVRQLPSPLRDRVRIVKPGGEVLYSGAFLSDIPFSHEQEFTDVFIDGDQYAILTRPLMRDNQVLWYAQLVDMQRLQRGELAPRALLYLIVSVAISALIFMVGRFFARRSLQPAEDMMQRLEQFTQDASHELRTPLAALRSSLDLALRNHKYREGILSAKDDLRQIDTLIERLLEMARLDSFTLFSEELDLSALVEQAVSKHRLLAKHVTIEADLAPHITVKGDPALLRQILQNLLTNAVKFSKKDNAHVFVQLTKHALSVRDDGIGIAAKDLPHIFDRFYQADASRAHGGSGLGLALVKRIVELHGWSVVAEGKPGHGASFTIRFVAEKKK